MMMPEAVRAELVSGITESIKQVEKLAEGEAMLSWARKRLHARGDGRIEELSNVAADSIEHIMGAAKEKHLVLSEVVVLVNFLYDHFTENAHKELDEQGFFNELRSKAEQLTEKVVGSIVESEPSDMSKAN